MVDTFNEKHIEIKAEQKETIALIECENAKDGVMYKTGENGQLEMKVWLEDNVIIAKPEDKSIKILVNNKEMEKGEWISVEKLK